LLRRTIAGLKYAGHRVSLMAPATSGGALLGPDSSAVDETLDWEDPSLTPLFAEEGSADPGLAARLAPFAACIAYTREPRLRIALERAIPNVVAHSPVPVGVHAAEWLAEPSRGLGADPPDVPPDMEATAREEAQATAFLLGRLSPGFLAIHPGSGSAAKNWPSDRFASLSRELGPEPFLLVEGPADAQSVAAAAEDGSCVRATHLSLRVLGAVLRRAGLFVGNDSGVTHLAAAWGASTLCLFGPTDPATWAPVGRLVAVVRSPSASMSDLSLADVSRAARTLRARAAARR
jgi:heptosyltransferase-3